MTEALVPLPPGCERASFIRRVKRFSVELEKNGERIWAHTNNTGAMLGLERAGMEALLSPAPKPGRKLPYTLERVRHKGVADPWIGVNTSIPNKLLAAAFHARQLDFAAAYTHLLREARLGECRLDACIEGDGQKRLWVECKNVTLVEDNIAYFPDAASERGRRHLSKLIEIVKKGERAAMFYLVQRPDAQCFAPADFIDPLYARLFCEALSMGVEAYAYQALQQPEGTALGKAMRIIWRPDNL